MENVTYLLGAGASAQALPITQNIDKRMPQFFDDLGKKIQEVWGTVGGWNRDNCPTWQGGGYCRAIGKALEALKQISTDHPTLDTFARMLWHRVKAGEVNEELRKFKAAMACYFVLLELLYPVDKRYESFLASVARRQSKAEECDPLGSVGPFLPEGLGILTWNYDLQLERAFRGFTVQSRHVLSELSNSGKLLRLNGSCVSTRIFPEAITPESGKYLELAYGPFEKDTFDTANSFYEDMVSGKFEMGIRFAWEVSELDSEVIRTARQTETLVVFGYSFPQFNRDVDRSVLYEMKNCLCRVILQVHSEDNGPVERLKEILPKRLEIERMAADQFFVPGLVRP